MNLKIIIPSFLLILAINCPALRSQSSPLDIVHSKKDENTKRHTSDVLPPLDIPWQTSKAALDVLNMPSSAPTALMSRSTQPTSNFFPPLDTPMGNSIDTSTDTTALDTPLLAHSVIRLRLTLSPNDTKGVYKSSHSTPFADKSSHSPSFEEMEGVEAW